MTIRARLLLLVVHCPSKASLSMAEVDMPNLQVTKPELGPHLFPLSIVETVYPLVLFGRYLNWLTREHHEHCLAIQYLCSKNNTDNQQHLEVLLNRIVSG